MNIIKLSAIPSTNTFLKELSAHQEVANYTVVVAENQYEGKGQRGSNWQTELGKNLTFSLLVNNFSQKHSNIFTLNILVAVAIIKVLKNYQIPNLTIKWPNDILSAKKKIAGILIENSFKSANEISSIIGVGLNVNQTNFENLLQASSMTILANEVFDKEEILVQLVEEIIRLIDQLEKTDAAFLWQYYHQHLFMTNKVAVFQVANNKPFSALIQGVSEDGKLLLLQEDDVIYSYDIKEIKMHY